MTAKNKLLTAPPYAVEQALSRLGGDLRIARLRRNVTIEELAERIGVGKRAVSDAERGKTSTSIGTYTAMLWALDLLSQLNEVAKPENDEEGQALARSNERTRARAKNDLSNDF